ncbi:MAG: molybdopterin-dependent oxidoreductase, partial [Anaplasma sp.]|nr:molybdopterin-dependent oxidoreductase [Anaplasma sp.]
LGEICNSNHEICEALMAAENPMIILGQDAIVGDKGHAVLMNVLRIAQKFNVVRDGWNGFNVLHKAAARVGGLDIGFLPEDPVNFGVSDILSAAANNDIQVLYLLGADEIDVFSVRAKNPDLFVIYQGHHSDQGAQVADLILPGAAFTEKRATYVNTEG